VFYDEGISGKVSVFNRNAFRDLYLYCLENSVKIVVFESISRFSRDLYELEVAYRKLTSEGITLISVNEGDFEDDRVSKLHRTLQLVYHPRSICIHSFYFSLTGNIS
jgi:DNA invertase Pin-like site-specific DNA recombinase